ncbi:MAG: hypothetical protein KDK78_06570 [Chlamydiia bacterium]|nr:hypothetical protein [Chlamydiia bacterium]
MHSLQRIFAYGTGGVLLEVAFTSIKDSIANGDPRLQGYTQLYVVPLYALGGLYVFEPLHDRMRQAPTALRLSVYAAAFFAIEALAGLTLTYVTGDCPWAYSGWGSVYRVIRLTHAPVWMLLGGMAEIFRHCLESYRIQPVCEDPPIEATIRRSSEMLNRLLNTPERTNPISV